MAPMRRLSPSKYSIKLVSQIILTFKTKIGKCSIHLQKTLLEKLLWETEVFTCVPFDLECI